VEIDGSTITEGQHNRGETPDQRAIPVDRTRDRWLAAANPWIILAVWLAAVSAAVIYWSTRKWGFLGDLLLIIMLLASLLAFATWLTAWSWLAARTWPSRLAIFLVGTVGMLAITGPMLKWHEHDGSIIAAEFLIGLALPFVMLRRRGWRIVPCGNTVDRVFHARQWQFSVADILVGTTGLAALLGLQTGRQVASAEVFLLGGVAILGAPLIVCIFLSDRRVWWRLLASIAIGLVFTVACLASSWPSWQDLLEVLLYITTVFLTSLLISLGGMRAAGYRFR
jgi:hypothetical protein